MKSVSQHHSIDLTTSLHKHLIIFAETEHSVQILDIELIVPVFV